MSNDVAVIIVSHHSADDLERCLPSIPFASTTPTPTLVIDNATSDDSVATVTARFPTVRLIESADNLGYGKAVNKAAQDVNTPWILVTNPDTEFHEGSIDALVAAAEGFPKTGSAGPRILNPDGSVYPSARALPSVMNGIGHAVFSKIWPRNPWSHSYHQVKEVQQSRTLTPTGWLSGACLLVRRSLFTELGGFDPRFFMYFEDVDLGDRIHHAGYINLYVPEAVITHVGGQSTRRYSKRMRAVHHQSAYLYLSKHYSAWYHAPLRLALRVGLALRNAFGR